MDIPHTLKHSLMIASLLALSGCSGGDDSAPATLEPPSEEQPAQGSDGEESGADPEESTPGDDSGTEPGEDETPPEEEAAPGDDTTPGDDTDPESPQGQVPTLPEQPYNYANIELPEHYTSNSFNDQALFQHAAIDQDNTPDDNPITDHGATLGRVLFYDIKLSANGTISCASCHQAEHGFSDPEVLSRGFDDELTRRHSMGLTNARFYDSGKFFWDERADTLEEQVLMPFQDPVEMGLTLDELEQIVAEQTYYPALFANAFGDETINSDRIARALAQFVRSMVSTTAKYDIARAEVESATDNFPGFTDQENQGKRLFLQPITLANGDRANCAGCHVSEAFIGPVPNAVRGSTTATNNGLDADSTDDLGVYETTGNPNDIGKFKVPSLRNIGARPPYMHDGRFATLEEVIEHYSSGIQPHPNLMAPLITSDGEPARFDFTQEEKDALVAFLHTLTDETMLADEKYSDPFQ
ncbi:cytochrome-c peroxidase [Ferrimonas marina]|uniref:Cytochrome c peroxidase n=1 Tax=Ferrimonas marina TaxID=299255 RepID=A0A1M5R477_9GAMM|nr:cytochrome c peroxidase [Ferrimonas marina]SHH21194.1 cytochrome c peroxidase [Ferrimonas marina]